MDKAKIITGPNPIQIWMRMMISKYVYIVQILDNTFQLNIQIQKLKLVEGTEFRQYGFEGYDELTGRKVSSDHVVWTKNGLQGVIKISKKIASNTELAHKFGDKYRKKRKYPLPPLSISLKKTN